MIAATSTEAGTAQLGVYFPAAPATRTGPLLVATDRSDASLAALRAARVLDATLHEGVTVLAVVEPLPIIIPEPGSLLQPLVISPEMTEVVRKQTADQIRKAGVENSWTVEVESGRPAEEIAKAAGVRGARLVIMGATHHGIVDRILDGDTALDLLRDSDTPVLLVSPGLESLPKSVVLAVDFSPESMNAARTAIPLLDPAATVYLAHVKPSVTIFDGSGLWEEEYDNVASREIEQFRNGLALPPTMRVETALLAGKPAAALAEFAKSIDADLIVSGSHGTGLIRRIFVGSVASGLLRKAVGSLLIVPTPRL